MLVVKLSRIGKKNQPHYRLIVTEKSRDPFGKTLEIFGNYNPRTKDLTVKADRINYWLQKGAKMTPSVNNLLVEKGVVQGKKVRASRDPKNKKGAEDAKAKEAEKAPAAKETEKTAENSEKIEENSKKE